MLTGMDVRLLIVEDCPHSSAAARLLRTALDDVGLAAVAVQTQVVADLEQAVSCSFAGSPTFLINGRDPFTGPGRSPALACRIYHTRQGLGGVPDIQPLRKALKQAADLPT